jgi:hypothetical protein
MIKVTVFVYVEYNFGISSSPLNVLCGNVPCGDEEWLFYSILHINHRFKTEGNNFKLV